MRSFFVRSFEGSIRDLLDRQFDLVYFSKGAFTFLDTEKMAVLELKHFHDRLYNQLEAEKKAREDAVNNPPKPRRRGRSS